MDSHKLKGLGNTIVPLIYRFEDLKMDTLSEVKGMLDYLNFDYDTEGLEKRLYSDFGQFHR